MLHVQKAKVFLVNCMRKLLRWEIRGDSLNFQAECFDISVVLQCSLWERYITNFEAWDIKNWQFNLSMYIVAEEKSFSSFYFNKSMYFFASITIILNFIIIYNWPYIVIVTIMNISWNIYIYGDTSFKTKVTKLMSRIKIGTILWF